MSTAQKSRYYDQPILKEPVWEWEIAAYFFTGGLAGASGLLASMARMAGNRRLARNALAAAVAGVAVSLPLLIVDLGRPERFHHMLRVFRPTSPMNIGTWLLTAFGGSALTVAGSELTGWFKPLGRVAGVATGLLGPLVSTYTGVLVADTSVPIWHEARRQLPFLFAASAAASAGGLACVLSPVEDAAVARRYALAGAAAELVLSETMERELAELAAPYRKGAARRFTLASRNLTLAGTGLLALAGRTRGGAAAGGCLLLAGALNKRLAVWKAGIESARGT